jgi:hypothetical protein
VQNQNTKADPKQTATTQTNPQTIIQDTTELLGTKTGWVEWLGRI